MKQENEEMNAWMFEQGTRSQVAADALFDSHKEESIEADEHEAMNLALRLLTNR